MDSPICSIVPPYVLRSIIESQGAQEDERLCAQSTLDHRTHYTARRCDRFDFLSQPLAVRRAHPGPTTQAIVPEVLLQHIADSEAGDVDDETRQRAKRDLEHARRVHARRVISQDQVTLVPEEQATTKPGVASAAKPKAEPQPSTGFYRAVYDAKNDPDEDDLPGKVVRVEGQKAGKDETANDAYDNVGRVLDFYLEHFDWKSIDNKNMHVISTVHFGKKYENAFWDPTRLQMVFGDGDTFLYRFASCLDVIGHELTVSRLACSTLTQRHADHNSTPSRSTPARSSTKASRVR